MQFGRRQPTRHHNFRWIRIVSDPLNPFHIILIRYNPKYLNTIIRLRYPNNNNNNCKGAIMITISGTWTTSGSHEGIVYTNPYGCHGYCGETDEVELTSYSFSWMIMLSSHASIKSSGNCWVDSAPKGQCLLGHGETIGDPGSIPGGLLG
ncbi:Uncharacterised protein at_DN0107 [Pycnogonum litorale]